MKQKKQTKKPKPPYKHARTLTTLPDSPLQNVKRPTTPPKYAAPTKQVMAEGFTTYAKSIADTLNRLRRDDPEIERLYNIRWQLISIWREQTKKHIKNCPDFPALPIGGFGANSYERMTGLAEYCGKIAKQVIGIRVKRKYVRSQEIVPIAIDDIEKHGFDSKAALMRKFSWTKGTLEKAIRESDILQSEINRPHPERKKPVELTDEVLETYDEEAEPEMPIIEADEIIAEALELIRKEHPLMYEVTKANIDGRDEDGRRELGKAIGRNLTILEPENPIQHKKL